MLSMGILHVYIAFRDASLCRPADNICRQFYAQIRSANTPLYYTNSHHAHGMPDFVFFVHVAV